MAIRLTLPGIFSRHIGLRHLLLRHIAWLIGVNLVGMLVVVLLFVLGRTAGWYNYANYQELQAQDLVTRVTEEQRFDPSWVPADLGWVILAPDKRLQATNINQDEAAQIVDFLNGSSKEASDSSRFMAAELPGGKTLEVRYYIGTRYSATWANQWLPPVEYVVLVAIAATVICTSVAVVHHFARRIEQELAPMLGAAQAIGAGNLDVSISSSSIVELNRVRDALDAMRESLQVSLEEQWTAEQERSDRLAELLHELRTPLTVVKANAEFLKSDAALCVQEQQGRDEHFEQVTRHVRAIEEATVRLEHLATSLHTTLTNTSYEVSKESVTVGEVCTWIDAEAQALAAWCMSQWNCKIACPLAELAIPRDAAEKIVGAVVTNAFEHGGHDVQVCLEVREKNNGVEFCIEDSGAGFSQYLLQHACDRGVTSRLDKEGHGLGLYAASSTAQAYGGFVELSNRGKSPGARVVVWLPIKN